MRLIDADVLVKHKVTGEIGNLSGDFVPGFAIANAPTIEAEPVRHGRWVLVGADKRGRGGVFNCTICNRCRPHKSDYCPNCGAKMDAKEAAK